MHKKLCKKKSDLSMSYKPVLHKTSQTRFLPISCGHDWVANCLVNNLSQLAMLVLAS